MVPMVKERSRLSGIGGMIPTGKKLKYPEMRVPVRKREKTIVDNTTVIMI
jgi:hypothetical protein